MKTLDPPSESAALAEKIPWATGRPQIVVTAAIYKVTLVARRKQMIAKVTGIGLLVGLVTSLLLPVRFSATTRLMTPQQTQSSAALLMSQLSAPSAGALAAAAGGGGLSLKNPNDIYIGLLNSRPIADVIIEQFKLMEVYGSRDMTAARKKLSSNTTITSEKSGLLAIAVTDKDKERAAAIANAYTVGLRDLSKRLAISEASQRRSFYEDQLKRAKDDLVTAEATFQNVQLNKGLVQPDAQAKAMIGGLADLQAQIAAKEVQLQAERSYSTEQNPDIQLTERELSSLRDQVAKLRQPSRSRGSADLGLGDVPDAGLAYLSAEHEVQYRQVLFDLLLKQYDAARLDEAKYASIIQVVEPAVAPDRKSFPSRIPIILIFTFLAFIGACSYPIATDYARSHVEVARSLSELKSALTWR